LPIAAACTAPTSGAVERAERNGLIDNLDRIATALGASVPQMLEA
jgi:hypothetical protein